MKHGVRHLAAGIIFASQLMLRADATAATDIGLTTEERAWIIDHPVIRAGHDLTYSPYALQDATGQIVGIDPDYLELIARRTGLKFRHEVRSDWGRVVDDFKAGQIDLLLSLGRISEREQYLTYTRSYASAPNVIITRSDSPNLLALGDLKGRTIAIPRDADGLRRDLERNVPGNEVVVYGSPVECYKAVARGEVYASVGNVANASYLIKLHQLANLRLGRVVSAPTEIYLGVRKDWPILVQIINKVLGGISTEERERITNRWIEEDTSAARMLAKAFKVTAAVAAVTLMVFLLAFFHNRRLARELAARRRIQSELEQTRDQLVQASQERGELMHMVAHDLRSPLTAIQLGMELLQRNPLLTGTGRAATTASRINESADRMARLIDNLLSAQNVEEGHFRLNFGAGDALQLARAAVSSLATAAQHKQIAIETVLPPGAVQLCTDYVALQQVVDNLLSNALKYSPVGSRVALAVSTTAAHCRFEVRDHGPGVKPEEREKIFAKYFRGSAQPTQGETSSGLGLWIVRRIVTGLYGQVWCEPGVGNIGSVFVVELPLTPPEESASAAP